MKIFAGFIMQHTSEKISVTVPTETSVAGIQVIFRILFPEKNRSKKFQFQNACLHV